MLFAWFLMVYSFVLENLSTFNDLFIDKFGGLIYFYKLCKMLFQTIKSKLNI